MKASGNSIPKISIPKTADGCSVTITSSFAAGISLANMLETGHYPKGGGAYSQENTMRKLLINPNSGGVSRTIRTSYYKAGLANYIHTDGRGANAVLIIGKV